MTRETKIGLIVAFSFLLLVGGVVFYKLYVTEPAEDDSAATATTPPEPKSKRSAEPVKKADQLASTAIDKIQQKPADAGGPPPPDSPADKAPMGAPPAPESPVLTGRPDSRPPPLPASLGGNPALTTKPGLAESHPFDLPASESTELASRASIGAQDTPPPPESTPSPADTRPGAGRPALDMRAPEGGRPAFPALGEKPMPPAEPAGRPGTPGAGRPTFDIPMNPPEKTAQTEPDRDSRPQDAPPRPEGSPRDGPRFPPVPERPATPSAAEPPVPLALPPEARSPGGAKPSDLAPTPTPPPSGTPRSPAIPPRPPSSDAFDRKYDPPAQLGKPTVEPSRDDEKRGIPVEIRPQPDLASITGSGAVRDSGNVLIYDREVHTVRAGDTYATISQLKYGTAKYAEALALYNREQDARLATLAAGKSVFIPPAEVLEKKYKSAIDGTTASTPPADPVRRDLATSFNPAGSRPTREGLAPAGAASDKRYRVRTGDTLWNIAKASLGNGERWTEIMRLNRDVLPDINRLQDGLILKLPADAKVDSLPPSP